MNGKGYIRICYYNVMPVLCRLDKYTKKQRDFSHQGPCWTKHKNSWFLLVPEVVLIINDIIYVSWHRPTDDDGCIRCRVTTEISILQGETPFTRRTVSKRTKLVTEDQKERLEAAAGDHTRNSHRFTQVATTVRPHNQKSSLFKSLCTKFRWWRSGNQRTPQTSWLVDVCLVVTLEMMIFLGCCVHW